METESVIEATRAPRSRLAWGSESDLEAAHTRRVALVDPALLVVARAKRKDGRAQLGCRDAFAQLASDVGVGDYKPDQCRVNRVRSNHRTPTALTLQARHAPSLPPSSPQPLGQEIAVSRVRAKDDCPRGATWLLLSSAGSPVPRRALLPNAR
jgi:hypothetical protein